MFHLCFIYEPVNSAGKIRFFNSEIMMMQATTNHILTGTEEHQLLQRLSVEDTPAIALDRDEKKRVIRGAIDELPTKMRETFILHFYEELSHQEISEKQNISYQNVCKRISQARAILALELRGYFIGEDMGQKRNWR
jgi:RNA polymerase sigma factor, sigma-70 family